MEKPLVPQSQSNPPLPSFGSNGNLAALALSRSSSVTAFSDRVQEEVLKLSVTPPSEKEQRRRRSRGADESSHWPQHVPSRTSSTPSVTLSGVSGGSGGGRRARGILQSAHSGPPSDAGVAEDSIFNIDLKADTGAADEEPHTPDTDICEAPSLTSERVACERQQSGQNDTLNPSPITSSGDVLLAHLSFPAVGDCICRAVPMLCGIFSLLASVLCIVLGCGLVKLGGAAAQVIFAVAVGVLAMSLLGSFLRLRFPTLLRLECTGDAAWTVVLKQRARCQMSARPLKDLEAFVETFGYFSWLRLRFTGQRLGFATSRFGTLHLFFAGSPSGLAPSTVGRRLYCSGIMAGMVISYVYLVPTAIEQLSSVWLMWSSLDPLPMSMLSSGCLLTCLTRR